MLTAQARAVSGEVARAVWDAAFPVVREGRFRPELFPCDARVLKWKEEGNEWEDTIAAARDVAGQIVGYSLFRDDSLPPFDAGRSERAVVPKGFDVLARGSAIPSGSAIRLQKTGDEPLQDLILCDDIFDGMALYLMVRGAVPVWVGEEGDAAWRDTQFPPETKRIIIAGSYDQDVVGKITPSYILQDWENRALAELSARGYWAASIWPRSPYIMGVGEPYARFCEENDNRDYETNALPVGWWKPRPAKWWKPRA